MRLRRSVSSVLSVGLMAGLTLVAGAAPGSARPAPGPATYGSVTPSVAATATAASAAVPPRRSTSMPACVDSGVSETTAPK